MIGLEMLAENVWFLSDRLAHLASPCLWGYLAGVGAGGWCSPAHPWPGHRAAHVHEPRIRMPSQRGLLT